MQSSVGGQENHGLGGFDTPAQANKYNHMIESSKTKD